MKEYILKTSPLLLPHEGESSSTDEIGKLCLQEMVSAGQVSPQGGLPLTTLLDVYPDKRVYAFHGQMGAGKTTFVKQLCEELGVTDIVNSPTFAIVNVYDLPVGGNAECGMRSAEIYHFDCYRIKDLREAYDMGTEEYLYSGNYCFIEWPEMIEELLPEDTVHVILTVNEDGTRTMKVEML